MFFLKAFILDVTCVETSDKATSSDTGPPVTRGNSAATPPPVMTVNKPESGEATQEAQDLLMQFDELTQDLQVMIPYPNKFMDFNIVCIRIPAICLS